MQVLTRLTNFLSRVDLRPVQSNQSDTPRAEDFEEPHVVTEATEADTAGMDHSTTRRHRMSRLLDFNRLRNAAPEERIATLRRYRTQERNDTASDGAESGENVSSNGQGDATRRSRFSRTIRAALDVRTVRNGSPLLQEENAQGGRGA